MHSSSKHSYSKTDDRKSGIALTLGSVGQLFTMAIHPRGAGTLTPSQLDHFALASAFAHTIAMLSTVLLVLGACGLTRRLAELDAPTHPTPTHSLSNAPAPTIPDRLAISALVFFLFSALAIVIATAVSGFIVPGILHHMLRDIPEAAPTWRIATSAVFQLNQTFAAIYTIGASIAIILWSASALRHGGISRPIATYGCISAPLLILGILIGHLRLDVHGMTAIVIAQAIWFIATALRLRTPPQEASTAFPN